MMYASDNNGKLPYHTNGFGNALLLLVKSGVLGNTNDIQTYRFLTATGDDGEVYREAIKTDAPIPEEKCSRIYIQGLTSSNNLQIAILFDKKATPGGGHFPSRSGKLIREVCLVDGSMQMVIETNWPAFASNQVELLVNDGMSRSNAEHYYRIP